MGELQAIKPTKSMWYLHYVDSPILDDSTLLPKFCKGSDLFDKWQGCDVIGSAATPTELLVLRALQYLGRGWTFDDIEETTAMSAEVILYSYNFH
ncbi:hypothetical protein ACHAWX_003722 [Stephanocyclus meneghinianus]